MTTTPPVRWQLLYEASNKLEAIFIQGRLQTEGIPVHIVSEPAAELYGITHGTLALAKIYVPEQYLDAAQTVLDEEAPLPPEDDPSP